MLIVQLIVHVWSEGQQCGQHLGARTSFHQVIHRPVELGKHWPNEGYAETQVGVAVRQCEFGDSVLSDSWLWPCLWVGHRERHFYLSGPQFSHP